MYIYIINIYICCKSKYISEIRDDPNVVPYVLTTREIEHCVYVKLLFIVLSLVAALLLPIKRLIEVKGLPTHRDSATLHSGVTELVQ